MESPSRVDVEAARAFLEGHFGRPIDGVELVGEGAWSRCFGFRDRDRELVVRFGRFVDDFENDRRAASFDAPGLPVPRLETIGRAFEAWFAISERVFGEPLEQRSASRFRAVLPSLFEALDAIREIDIASTTGYGGWDRSGDAPAASWRDFLLAVDRDTPDMRTRGWRKRLLDSPGDGERVFRAGYEQLGALVDASPPERHVVHADLINRNVLVEDDRITGVFDWGCSFYGDFLYDLAWLEFWGPAQEAMAGLDFRRSALDHFDAIGLHVPDFDSRLRGCMVHIGLDHLAYHAWSGDADALAWVSERLRSLLEGG